ncbi:MAG: c-type cytochrome, partial [Mariprofundaceae bacterium]|nr:c-type cytochrome [Mariprofundaceae bacterium]
MKGFKIPAFWQAVLVVVVAYLILKNAFPPVTPHTLMIQYMIVVVVGVLLYFSYDEVRFTEFKSPILNTLRSDGTFHASLRWGYLIAIPALAAYMVYGSVKPSFEAPVELRQVHPAPPSSLRVFNKKFDLTKLQNPLRMKLLEGFRKNRDEGWKAYKTEVKKGRDIFYSNCFYCHGDLLDGEGVFAKGFNPTPANFQDVGTIAQLQEAFVFWRIATGGPGLPKEGTPWNSAMPVWHEMLSEADVWHVITFLYDYVGQVPRIWDQERSKAVTGIKEELLKKRAGMKGKELYEFRCAACHGANGAGDGPAAKRLYPKPRDFTTGLFKYKTSPGKMVPRDEDLFRTIKFGLNGTVMPAWKSLMSDEQINSLIPILKGFDTFGAWAPKDASDSDFDDAGHFKGKPVSITEALEVKGQIPYTPESIA